MEDKVFSIDDRLVDKTRVFDSIYEQVEKRIVRLLVLKRLVEPPNPLVMDVAAIEECLC